MPELCNIELATSHRKFNSNGKTKNFIKLQFKEIQNNLSLFLAFEASPPPPKLSSQKLNGHMNFSEFQLILYNIKIYQQNASFCLDLFR